MSIKQLFMGGSPGDQKGREVPRRPDARITNVLYLGDVRETRLIGGAFSYDHPHLAIDLSSNLHETSARVSEPGRYDALVVGWSVPESEAAALISHIRAKGYPLAIVVVGEHALDVLREAGADHCVQKGGSLLARLPVAIEEAIKTRTAGTEAHAPKPAVTTVEQPKETPNADQSTPPVSQELATLRVKESRLRALVDKLPACIVRLSPDGLVLATNAVALSLLGAAQPNQLLKKPLHTLIDAASRERWNDFVTRVCAGEQRSCEVSMTALDGVSRVVEAVGVPSPAEGGSSSSALLVLRDISDRKRLEASLEEAIRRAAPLEVLGPPAETVAPEQVYPSQHTPGSEETASASNVPDARVLRDLEADLQALAGKARMTFDELGALLRHAAEEHDATFTRQVDAYARVKAEQLEHWRSYEAFVQGAASGVFRVSADNRLQSSNPAFASMLGYDAPELLIEAAASIGGLTDEARWQHAVEHWRRGSRQPVDSHWRKADGAVAAFRLHGRLVANPGGDGEYIEVVAEDVAAQRALEAQLRRARRWEDAARVTSGIAADLTHLVASIGDAAEGLLRGVAADDAAREHADALRQSVSRVQALSRQLVAFGRKEARDPSAFDVNDAVRSLEAVLRRLVDEHIEIALALAPSLGTVETSEPAFQEAVVHLTVAAASALPAGGRIDIATASRDVDQSEGERLHGVVPGRYAALSIAASGWGLDAEIDDRLSDVVRGAGADEVSKGLASARRTIGRMGGHVSVEGVTGTSLTFHLLLPRVHGTNEFESEELAPDLDALSPSGGTASGPQRVEM